jgi:hypothetical protein
MKKKEEEIKIETGIPSENSSGKCRIDSAEGCRKYFEERFKKFKIEKGGQVR